MGGGCGDADDSRASVVSPDFLGPESLASLKEEFSASQPFAHVVFRDLCNRDVLLKARRELIDNVEAKFKETDLFKVYQTGDLANMDGLEPELAAKLPTLLEVRNAIYSQAFRTFVEQVTGLPGGTLIEKTDCSSNCYAQGCHLLCHDDVISTRRVSYIIYLTDPEDPWTADDGGALELFPETARLSPSEREFLAKWINPLYLERGSIGSMVAQWEKSSCAQLHGFLRSDVADPILEAMHREDAEAGVGEGRVPSYKAGCNHGWAECGPCHKQRFLRYTPSDPPGGSESVGRLLHAACHDLFASEAFAKWLLGVTELAPRGMRSEVRRFRPGLDYTVAAAGGMGAAVQLEATLCFVSADTEDKIAAWGSDEVGGFQCYILAEEEAIAASETYRTEEEDDSLISCSAAFNTLNLILRDTSLMKFVKYVSAGAPGSRWDIAAAYTTDLADDEMACAEM